AWAVAEEAGGRSGERLEVRSDLSTLARGGILNLIGAGCTGLFNFLLWVVVARKLRIHELGMFHQAVGLFTILTAVSQLGAQAGLVRTISRFRALGRIQDVRRILAVALIPVLAVGAALGLVAYLFAPQLSNIFARGADGVAPYLRVLGPLLPLAAIYMVAVSATQGFGTMIPAVVVEKIGKPAAQLGLILVAVGMGSAAMALAWGAPILLGLGVIAVWLRRLLHRFERRHLTDLEPASPKGPMGRLAREFWRFTAPRSLASIFQQTILQLDPLLIGALASPSLAGIYGTATKYLLVPHLAIAAILQVMQPKIAELLARESHERAQTVYQTATWWLIAGVWPIYLTLVVFAPFLLRIFTPEIVAGHSAVTILALAML
ncbi:MAG: lipopolysaccharide biosynthesis protein, partial [Candidatus Methylomirabilales bacterium]